MESLREEVDELLMVRQVFEYFTFCGKFFAKAFGTDIVCCSLRFRLELDSL